MNSKRFRIAALALGLIVALSATAAFADDKADVTAAVHKFFDNIDPQHIKTALPVCDSPASVVDEFPPHAWQGAKGCANWWRDFSDYNKKNGIEPQGAALGTPWSVDVSGDRAYFVSPATYTYKQNGKTTTEAHAVFTAALKKSAGGWKITGWSWAKH